MYKKDDKQLLQGYEDGVIDTFKSRLDLFKRKNANYGAAWVKAGIIMQFMLNNKEIELHDSDDINVFELYGRMLEKMIRFMNLRFGGETDKVGEATIETMSDIGVQAFMIVEHEKRKVEVLKKNKK